MSTIRDLITDALKEIGVVAEGEVPSAEAAADALRVVNRMVAQWSLDGTGGYYHTRALFPFTANTNRYLLGPGGTGQLLNGGFEDDFDGTGVAGDWTGGGTGVFSKEVLIVHGGIASQKIFPTGGVGVDAYTAQTVEAGSLQPWTYSVWAYKASAAVSRLYVLSSTGNYLNSAGAWTATRTPRATAFGTVGAWGELTGSFTTELNCTSLTFQLAAVAIGANDELYYDDVAFASAAIQRPVSIEHVHFIDTATSPTVEHPMKPLTEDEYACWPTKGQTSPYPQAWYYNPTFPAGTLDIFPIPTSTTLRAVVYGQTNVAQFASLGSEVSLPPGYEELLLTHLAIRLAGPWQQEVTPDLRIRAQQARAIVARANLRPSSLSFPREGLIQGGSHYDIRRGY